MRPPDRAVLVRHGRRAVHRFHRCMREKLRFVFLRIDGGVIASDGRAVCSLALSLHRFPGIAIERRPVLRVKARVVETGVRSVVKSDFEHLERCCACQYCRATTATPFEIGTTSITPGRFITDDLSKLATLPPCTGLCLIAAQTISGTVKSRPKTAAPLSFAGTSIRANGLPRSFQSPSDLGFGLAGGVTLTASSATSPDFTHRPVSYV